MPTFFHKITKLFSIKNIVLFGVGIMALTVILFAITMFYVSNTIRYDKDTLKHILSIEEQNKQVLTCIKDLNTLDIKIFSSNKVSELEELFDNYVDKKKINYPELMIQSKLLESYKLEIKNITNFLDEKYNKQLEILENNIIMKKYQEELDIHKTKLNKLLYEILITTDSIYGIGSLETKRFNKKLIRNYRDKEETSLPIDTLRFYSRIMTYSKETDAAILKLSDSLKMIINSNDLDLINNIHVNNILQIYMLIEGNIKKFFLLKSKTELFEKDIYSLSLGFSQLREMIQSIITLKKLEISQLKVLDELRSAHSLNNEKLFKSVNLLNSISNDIKIEILENSDNISKKSAFVILTVGSIMFLIILSSAMILIYRINYPLTRMIDYINNLSLHKNSLKKKLPVGVRDEFGQLSLSFNAMTSKLYKNISKIEKLNYEVIQTQKEVIFTMGAIGETRSKETGNHVKRVAEYSKLLALKYGMSEEEAELIKNASPMHDIGKVGIPDSILKKEGPLDEHEWEIMKTHTSLGYEMLKCSSKDIMKAASVISIEHHEKWDGSGYPNGIRGKDIHIYARITALADVFDALGSSRCYKKAWPLDNILKLLEDEKGKHFDPELIDIFLDSLDEILHIKNEYED